MRREIKIWLLVLAQDFSELQERVSGVACVAKTSKNILMRTQPFTNLDLHGMKGLLLGAGGYLLAVEAIFAGLMQ